MEMGQIESLNATLMLANLFFLRVKTLSPPLIEYIHVLCN